MLAIIGTRPPPRMAGVMKKPSVRMNTRIAPAASDGRVSGKNTRQNTVHSDAPRDRAAWNSRSSSRSIEANSGRTRNGSRMFTVPRITPN